MSLRHIDGETVNTASVAQRRPYGLALEPGAAAIAGMGDGWGVSTPATAPAGKRIATSHWEIDGVDAAGRPLCVQVIDTTADLPAEPVVDTAAEIAAFLAVWVSTGITEFPLDDPETGRSAWDVAEDLLVAAQEAQTAADPMTDENIKEALRLQRLAMQLLRRRNTLGELGVTWEDVVQVAMQ